MKILHISTTDDGGAGKAALRLHRGLLSLGVDSRMLVKQSTSGVPGIFSFAPRRPTLRVRLYDEIRRRRLQRDFARYTQGRPVQPGAFSDDRTDIDLSGSALLREADIIHLHWIAHFADYSALFAASTGKPIVWTLHDMHPLTGGCHYAGECSRYEGCCGGCPQLASTDTKDLSRQSWVRKNSAYSGQQVHVVSPSHWLAAKVRQSLLFRHRQVKAIPYGIPVNIFQRRHKTLCRELLDLPREKTIVLFVAANVSSERKGSRYLMEALKILSKSVDASKIGLAVCGSRSGTAFEPLEMETFLLGHIRDERLLSACYSAADVFVIPSLEDNLPNTVLESMACGTPVVGFESGGIPEMIRHRETGLLARERDAHDLAEKLSWILAHPQEREAMGSLASARIAREYTEQRQAERYLAVYKQL